MPPTATRTDTKTLIMDSAEHMIAEHGVNGVSNRAILSEAGVNSAALHYHFNSREGLLEAVLVRYGRIASLRRLEMINEFIASERRAKPEDIVNIIVDPMVYLLSEKGEAGRRFLRFIGRLQSDRSGLHHEEELKHFPEFHERVGTMFTEACPEVTVEERSLRITLIVDTMLQSLSNAEFMTREWCGDEHGAALALFVARLKVFLVSGLAAPPVKLNDFVQ